MPDDRLEADLRELGRHLDVPPAPDVTGPVGEALMGELTRPGRRVPLMYRLLHLPRLAQAAAALLLVISGLLVVSPDARAAVIDVLRFAGIDIRDEPAPVPVPPIASPLPGQESMSLAEARAAVTFDVIVPSALGEPDAVTLADDRVVSLLYEARPPRPAIVIEEFGGFIDPTFQKYGIERAIPIQIGEHHGIWIDRPHPLLYVDRSGQVREEAARMAGRTLIWQVGDTVLRMEGDLIREQAIEIARSTMP